MTYTDWTADTTLAPKLKELLNHPVLVQALSVLNELTAAKALGTTNAITSHAGNAHVLFGFDAGRASVIHDLNSLCSVSEIVAEQDPSYRGSEF